MSAHSKNTDSYSITVLDNRVVQIERMAEEDELLGIEWAISEVKDSLKHNGSADGHYGLKDRDELEEFMDFLVSKIGQEAVQHWQDHEKR